MIAPQNEQQTVEAAPEDPAGTLIQDERALLNELYAFRDSRVNEILQEQLSAQFTANYTQAINSDYTDAQRINALERNNGVSYGKGLLESIIRNVENNIKSIEEGDYE